MNRTNKTHDPNERQITKIPDEWLLIKVEQVGRPIPRIERLENEFALKIIANKKEKDQRYLRKITQVMNTKHAKIY